MQMRALGRNGPKVSEFGLGCMGMSGGYGPADDKECIATIHAALEAGITMLDTGDFYGAGQNEMLLREALKGGKRERAFIAVKFGAMRGPDQKFYGDDCRPQAVKNFLAYSLRRLGTDYIDLYQPARVDPEVPYEDTIGAIADMVKAGFVRHIGVSEASAKTLRRAHAVHPIAALQIEYSLFSRGIERDILPTLRELGIALVAYGVLSGGLISDRAQAAKDAVSEIRTRKPRFSAENFPRNMALVGGARRHRAREGCHHLTARLRLGEIARRRHRAADWRAPSRPARRGTRRVDREAFVERSRPHRSCGAGRRRRRYALYARGARAHGQ
jgi:aryl-alcohol dehydrogenase-like predicted oxidoreductase